MTSFPLKIVTPDGLHFEGEAQQVTVRTVNGDMGILAGHINCVAPLGKGRAAIVTDGERRYAACSGGFLTVTDGALTLLPITFQWENPLRS